jgi:hypothetical protein
MLLPLLAALFSGGPSLAADAASTIDQDATWSLAESPWRVDETVTIEVGATLTIEPGVTVELEQDARIVVEGALWAVSEGEPIVFTRIDDGEGEGSWAGIHFTDSAQDARYEGIDQLVSGSALVGCELRHGARAVLIEGSSPLIRDCSFTDNLFEPEGSDSQGGAAIRIRDGSRAVIDGNLFLRNIVGGWGYGGAIEVLVADPVIIGNVFEGNVSAYGGALCMQKSQGPILGNHFEGNSVEGEGGAVSLYSSAGAFFDNTVIGNESVFDGGGIHVCGECVPHAAPWVVDNVITDNVSRAIGAGGFGAAWIRGFMWNDLHDNLRSDEPSDMHWSNEDLEAYPAWVHSPAMPHNWWGSTDPEAIEETIVDGEDEDEYGVVGWNPPAEGPVASPTPRAVITTPMLRYDQSGQVMSANLVLYNPDEPRALDLHLFILIDQELLIPWVGSPDIEGLEPRGDGWRVTMPADAAIFATIAEPTRGTVDMPEAAAWVATLHDADTGELIGESLTTPVALHAGGAE